jgi:hypothetical protein
MKRLLKTGLFLSMISVCRAQTVMPTVVNSLGNQFTVQATTFEISVGESVITTLQSNNGTVTQGFLQPTYALPNAVTELEQRKIRIFPNPATDYLYLEGYIQISHYSILSMAGEIIKCDSGKSIFIEDIAAGAYILMIWDKNNISYTHKFIKF